ncbi:cache domain-containing protein [Vallitalea okinawensis]|uniref:cache domain-containing protein n=1 Tax=Vallitalea okinawensis TaxID=2078660 RepID=UPI000CFAF3C7|nr:cache domain-containing protein [Vallitalea okinawensis]
MLKKLNLKYKFILFLILSIHILLIGIFCYYYSRDIIKKNYLSLSSSNIAQKGENIETYMQLIEGAFEKVGKDERLLNQINTYAYNDQLDHLLQNYKLTIPGIFKISLVSKSGELYVTDITDTVYKPSYTIPPQSALLKKGWSISSPLLNEDQTFLHFTQNLESSNAIAEGKIILQIDTKYLGNIIHSTSTEDTDILLNNIGQSITLFHSTNEINDPLEAIKTDMRNGTLYSNPYPNGNVDIYDINTKYVFIYDYDNYPFQLIAVQPSTAINDKLTWLRYVILWTSIALTLISFVISVLLSNMVWHPLEAILRRFNSDYQDK